MNTNTNTNELRMTGDGLSLDTLKSAIGRTWWIILIQGIAAVIVGVLLLTQPSATLITLARFLGAYWLVGGILDVIGSFSRRNHDRGWLWSLLGGVIGIVAGLFLLGQPMVGALVLPVTLAVFIGVSAILSGVSNIVWAIRLRNEIQSEGWTILWGLISVILGIMIVSTPVGSALSLVLVGAILAIVGGISIIVFSFRLRRWARLARQA